MNNEVSRWTSPNTAKFRYGVLVLRRFALPTVVITICLAWLLTGIQGVAPGEVGLRENNGVLERAVLGPGVHLVWPRPFGSLHRFPVRRLQRVPIGLSIGAGQSVKESTSRADVGVPWLSGSTTELVVIQGLLTFQVDDSTDGLLAFRRDYVSPGPILAAMTEELLSEHVGRNRLDTILVDDKVFLADQIQAELSARVVSAGLGLRVLAFGITSIGPPPDLVDSFLDVESARIDAERELQDARINASSELVRVTMMGESAVADAQAAAAVRLTSAHQLSGRVSALARLFSNNADCERQRLLWETLAESIGDRPLVLLDVRLPRHTQVIVQEPFLSSSASNLDEGTTIP